MIQFYFIALMFFLLIFIYTRKISLIIKIFLCLVVLSLFCISITYWMGPPTRAVDKKWFEIGTWKHIILFLSMLLGMITNYIFEYFQHRIKAKEAEGEYQKPQFIWEKLFLPFVISILLFGYFWGYHSKEPMSLTLIFISYQNGFFWQSIWEKKNKLLSNS